MQNKYKMPPDVRKTVISIVQGYERRKIKLRRDEENILSLGSGKFETLTVEKEQNGKKKKDTERAFMPSGKGGKSSAVENQAMRLLKLHNSFDYRCNKAIDEALDSLPLSAYNTELAKKVRNMIFLSCILGKRFCFERAGIVGIEKSRFYQLRTVFLISIAKKLGYL